MAKQRIFMGVILIIAVTGLVLSFLAASLLVGCQRVPNTRNVKAVGVSAYENSVCTVNLTSIDWGLLGPRTTAYNTAYIKNEGNMPVVLNMSAIIGVQVLMTK